MEENMALRSLAKNTLFSGYNLVILCKHSLSKSINLWAIISLLIGGYKLR